MVECRRSPLPQFELRRPRLNKRKLKARGRLIRCLIISNVGSDNPQIRYLRPAIFDPRQSQPGGSPIDMLGWRWKRSHGPRRGRAHYRSHWKRDGLERSLKVTPSYFGGYSLTIISTSSSVYWSISLMHSLWTGADKP